MKISLSGLKSLNYIYQTGFDPYDYELDEILEKIGLQLGAVEGVEDRREWYKHAYVVRVMSCEKHPDADKLSLCLIDDGGVYENVERNENNHIQVVCGAPNVHADMWAVWLPPDSTVPATRLDDEPFVLGSREIRGKKSNGMLASDSELKICDDHKGILELEDDGRYEDLRSGALLSDFLEVADVIIDLENKMFTHRPDCFGEIGVARELSGVFGVPFTSPDWYKEATIDDRWVEKRNDNLLIETSNEAGDKVPRFMLQSVENVSFGESTPQTKMMLNKAGIKAINEVVDWTNYFMHMTAQPLHAYDYDKVVALSNGDKAVVKTRLATEGEKLKLLNGKEIELSKEDIVIATDTQAIGLAGIMGGSETEVDENTKNIIIECGTFDMYSIRRSSMRHGLFTDAVTRFNKGQSPLQNDRVLAKITDWACGFGSGTIASPTYDSAINEEGKFVLAENISRPMTGPEPISIDFINSRLGTQLTIEDVCRLLGNVEFSAYQKDDKELFYWAPFWRMDISIPEDIVEEVGRLYGYQNIGAVLPPRQSKPPRVNSSRTFKSDVRHQLSRLGANEVLTYSFVHGKLLKNIGLDPEKWAYHLRNALSPDLQYYRPSVLPSLMAKVPMNIRAQEGQENNEFALFEIGKAHVKGHQDENEPDIPAQYQRLAFVIAADQRAAKKTNNDAYYRAKAYVDELTNAQAVYLPLDSTEFPITAPFEKKRAAVIELDGRPVGVVGEFRSDVSKSMKLPEYCAGFELDIELLRNHVSETPYKKLSQYPPIHQDITFEVSQDTPWQNLEKLLHAELEVAHAEDNATYELESGDIYQPEGTEKKRITFKIVFTSYDKTLKTEEVNTLMDKIEKAAHEGLEAIRI